MTQQYVTYSTRSGLSDSEVLDIREAAKRSSVRAVARAFGVPKSTVHDIVSYKTWSHVPEPIVLNSYKNYTVYPDGRVLSNKTGKFLTQKYDRQGTVNVELLIDGARKSVSVASLVAKAFLGKKKVTKLSFKDDNSTNVHFTNLKAAK